MKLLTIIIITILITGCSSKNIITPEKSKFDNPISIDAVEGLDRDFMFGCDLSSLIAQENSGVVFYNEKGDIQDPVKTLADNGVNMVRVRVWNNPYDENGNGYGGGNCDTDNAIAIGKRATECKMAVFIDFHYSDFWTDPSKQMCPKAWGEYKYELSVQGQADAIRDCVEALASLGENAVGVCYWEPAWIPVPDDTEMTRSQIWEKYGSGWASSFASEYDSEDAGKYYGGSSWDNQALFDFEGHPLPSIEMFKMMRG